MLDVSGLSTVPDESCKTPTSSSGARSKVVIYRKQEQIVSLVFVAQTFYLPSGPAVSCTLRVQHQTCPPSLPSSFVNQIGARECILEEHGPSQKTLEEVMARCNVLCTPKPLKLFKGARDGVMKVR